MLMNRQTTMLASITCDLMESHALLFFRHQKKMQLLKMKEYESMSIDATYKLALKVVGQNRSQKHNFTSVIGTRGSPLGLVAAEGESPTTLKAVFQEVVPAIALPQVKYISSDVCTGKLFKALSEVCPKLRILSLDPLHLCFKVDSFSKKQRVRPTVVGLVMRSIM